MTASSRSIRAFSSLVPSKITTRAVLPWPGATSAARIPCGLSRITADPPLKTMAEAAQRPRPRPRGKQHTLLPTTSARWPQHLVCSIGPSLRTASSSTGLSRPRWSRPLRLSVVRNGWPWRWLPRPDTSRACTSRRVWSLPPSPRKPTQLCTRLPPQLRVRSRSSRIPSRDLPSHLSPPRSLHLQHW